MLCCGRSVATHDGHATNHQSPCSATARRQLLLLLLLLCARMTPAAASTHISILCVTVVVASSLEQLMHRPANYRRHQIHSHRLLACLLRATAARSSAWMSQHASSYRILLTTPRPLRRGVIFTRCTVPK